MPAAYYSRLSDLIDFSQLPANLQGLAGGSSVLNTTFYQNLDAQLNPGSLAVALDLVLLQEVRLDILDFALILNPSQVAGQATVIPLALHIELGILRFVDAFDPAVLAGAPTAYYPVLQAVAAVTPRELLRLANQYLVTGVLSSLSAFATQANSRYNLALPTTLPANEDAALDQLVTALAQSPAGAPTLEQAVYDLYVAATDAILARTRLAQLFKPLLGNDPLTRIDTLVRPDINARVRLTAGIELPAGFFIPVQKQTVGGADTYTPQPGTRVRLLCNVGDFAYSTRKGFGFTTAVNVTLPTAYPRLQLGQTGLQIDFTQIKVDLSGRRQLAEAIAEGRPANFSGVYIDSANLYLPSEWHITGGSAPTLGARHLLVGTGGISGTFLATSTGAVTYLFEATLFQDLSVRFNSFELTLRQNQVVTSGIAGTFTVAGLKGANGQPMPFDFRLTFTDQGYELAFRAATVNGQQTPVVARLGSFAQVRFTQLALGRNGADWYIEVAAEVVFDESLPIVGKVLPKQINIKRLLLSTDSTRTDLEVQPVWSNGTSVSGNLTTGLSITQTLNLVILDIIKVDLIRLSIARNAATGQIRTLTTFDAALKLGKDAEFSAPSGKKPRGFLLQVRNIGFYTDVDFKPGGGHVGPADVDVRFKLPDGVLVSINAGGIVGGGSLAVLENGNRYEASLGLTFQDKINLGAFVILLKKLPTGEEGPSLLALISVSFESNPIQLGYGFTLLGVGGLIGLHRMASIPALRAGLASGSLDSLLFPANPAQDAPLVLRTMDQAFPPAAGRYTFGLLAKIGWGTPALISLDAGLIIELPAPVRLVLIGIVRAFLPTAEAPVVRLRADFLGVIDFGEKKIAFDAVLVRSSILVYTLSGKFAFRLYAGEKPVFLMTAGGFHPAFQPPANADLPTLERITLALAQGGDVSLTLKSYLAITSNTVQFGSKLQLLVRLPSSFSLEGELGFDALFRFNPFYVEVRISAGMTIKRSGRALLSISLSLLVSGPAPWHIDGEGSFKILFFKIKFRVNRTFGGSTVQPALPTTDVRELLRAALQAPGNWEVQAPVAKPAGTVVLQPADASSDLLVEPGGALVVRQKVAPLDFPIEVYGNTRPVNGTRFVLARAALGTGAARQELPMSAQEEIREAFAPAQFRRMSDGEKLSAPAFQLLRSGLRLKAVDGLEGKEGVTRRLAFEMRLLEPDTSAASRTTSDATTAEPDGAAWIVAPVTINTVLPARNLQRLAKTSAVGRTRRSYEQRRPSRQAPDQVLWDEDDYAVASTRTLEPDPDAPNPFRSEAEATAYLRNAATTDPDRAGEWQVVPVYQLPIPISSSASLPTA